MYVIDTARLNAVHCHSHKSDLLVARRSLTYEGAAKVCLVEANNTDMIFESSLIRLTVDQARILPTYLFYYLNNPTVRNRCIMPYVTRSTISGINQANLNKVSVIVPAMTDQYRFIQVVDEFKNIRGSLIRHLDKLNELFQSLQHQAFTGTL